MGVKAQAGVWHARVMPADDVWLIAHERREWRCRLHPRALGLALAGGLLGELLLAGCVAITEDDAVELRNTPPPQDAFLHVMLAYIQSEPTLDVRSWLKFFAGGKATSLVLERSQLAGLVDEVEVGGARRRTVRDLRPSDLDAALWRPVRLQHLILGDHPSMRSPTWGDITLAGLVQAVGLLPAVLYEHHATGDVWLRQFLAEHAPEDLRRLLAAVQTLVGDVVLGGRP